MHRYLPPIKIILCNDLDAIAKVNVSDIINKKYVIYIKKSFIDEYNLEHLQRTIFHELTHICDCIELIYRDKCQIEYIKKYASSVSEILAEKQSIELYRDINNYTITEMNSLISYNQKSFSEIFYDNLEESLTYINHSIEFIRDPNVTIYTFLNGITYLSYAIGEGIALGYSINEFKTYLKRIPKIYKTGIKKYIYYGLNLEKENIIKSYTNLEDIEKHYFLEYSFKNDKIPYVSDMDIKQLNLQNDFKQEIIQIQEYNKHHKFKYVFKRIFSTLTSDKQ